MFKKLFLSMACCLLVSAQAYATSAAADAKITILEPQDGAVVSSPVKLRFGAEHINIAPAGKVETNSGHFHLLIDVAALPVAGHAIPKDAHHLHFGKGQTEATVELSPGQHTLQLELGDGAHVPHTPPVVSQRITITVR